LPDQHAPCHARIAGISNGRAEQLPDCAFGTRRERDQRGKTEQRYDPRGENFARLRNISRGEAAFASHW
jgi:hypothetical protein